MPHMHDRFERFFDPKFLFGVNVAIIIAAETLGNGRLFYDTGLIHVPVLIFVLLVSTRVFGRYFLYDPVLKKFLGWSLAALAILMLSYVIEFVDQNLGYGWPASAVYGGIISFHLTAVLCIAVGAFHILRSYGKMRFATLWLVLVALVGVAAFAASLAAYLGYLPYVSPSFYMLIAGAAGVATGVPTMSIATSVPALRDFAERLTAAITFMTVAAGAQALHLVAGSEYVVYQQATYVSHFAFYASLTLMFLAFGKLANLGGLYAGLRAEGKGPESRRTEGKSAMRRK